MARFSRRSVWARAAGKCEFCQLSQTDSVLPLELDHIRARKHRGLTTLLNTCLACAYCNGAKGSNVAGYDPASDALVPLFNPRESNWNDHFVWDGPILIGITTEGRATIEVLRINDANRIEHRRLLQASRKVEGA